MGAGAGGGTEHASHRQTNTTEQAPETKTTTTKSTKGNLTVYDLEKEGWRTVKFDRVIFWKMLADYPEPEKTSNFTKRD